MKRRTLLLAVIFCLVIMVPSVLVSPAVTASNDPLIEIRPITTVSSVYPRQTVTVAFEVINRSDEPKELVPDVALPAQWQLLLSPTTIFLPSGASVTETMVIFVPAQTEAKDYSVSVGYTGVGPSDPYQTSFHFHVLPTLGIDAQFIEAPTYSFDRPFKVKVLVINNGNTPSEVTFSLSDNLGVPISVTPALENLNPGESIVVIGQVAKPPRLDSSQVQRLTFRAQHTTDLKTFARTQTTVELIPTELPDRLAHHTIPLRLHTGIAIHDARRPKPIWSLIGSGTLSDGSTTKLDVHLTNHHQRIALRGDSTMVAVGNQNLRLSPLIYSARRGMGFEATANLGPISGQVLAYHTASGSAPAWARGYKVSYDPTDSFNLSVQHANLPDFDRVTTSVRTQIAVSRHIDVNAELALQRSPLLTATARRIQVAYRNQEYSSIATWDNRNTGYQGNSHPVSSWRLVSSLPIRSKQSSLTVDVRQKTGARHAPESKIQSASISLSGRVSGGTYAARYLTSTDQDPGELSRWVQSFRFHLSRSIQQFQTLTHTLRVSRTHDFLDLSDTTKIDYRLNYRLPTQTGAITPFLRVGMSSTHNWGDASVNTQPTVIGLGIRSERRFANNSRLTLINEIKDIQAGTFRTAFYGTYRLSSQESLDLRGSLDWGGHQAPTYSAQIGLSFPIDLAISRRSDIGEVHGKIVDEHGNPMPGLIIRVNGSSVTTGLDGRFSFPSIPVGTRHLIIEGASLQADRMFWPMTPMRLEVRPDDVINHEFHVVRSASVSGKVVVENGDQSSLLAGERQSVQTPSQTAIHGVVIVLQNGGSTRRVTVDSDGSFTVDGLHPGEWRLIVHPNGFEKSHRVQPSQSTLTLQSGDHIEVEVFITPIERLVEIIELSDVVVMDDVK